MAPSNDDLARQITALPCQDHSRALHQLAVVQDDQMLLMKSIGEDLRYLREEIQVNGSKGLQAILTDNYAATMQLMEVTRGLRANSKLKQALTEWAAANPGATKGLTILRKLLILLVGSAILSWLGVETGLLKLLM